MVYSFSLDNFMFLLLFYWMSQKTQELRDDLKVVFDFWYLLHGKRVKKTKLYVWRAFHKLVYISCILNIDEDIRKVDHFMKSLVILLSLPFIKNKKSKTTFKSSLNSHVYWHTMYTKYRVRPVYCIHCTHFYIRIQGHNKLETLENGRNLYRLFFIYMILCNSKLVYFFAGSLKMPYNKTICQAKDLI